MAISAALVKELRERTNCGMMECKNALVEADGDIDSAAEILRKKGMAKADKKAGRIAAEGVIAVAISSDTTAAAIVEANSETDFVSGGDDFKKFANDVAQAVLQNDPSDVDALSSVALDGGTVAEVRQAMIAKIGENIQVRRFTRYVAESGKVGFYLHGTRIGVLVEMEGGDEALLKDVAMHIAASKPNCVSEADVDAALIEKEKEIFAAQAKDSGKPDNIIEKMVEGRIKKFLAEITLVGQPFVKDPDQTVGQLLGKSGASVKRFLRLEVGEGIEKKEDNFAEEVMAQVRGTSE